MGRLVELDNQKKKETSNKSSTGRLVTIGDTSKIGAYTGTKFAPVEKKNAPISGASPTKTNNTDAWTRATASQTRIPEKKGGSRNSGTVMQGTTVNERGFSGNSRKFDKPTFTERVGKTISGGAKGSAASNINAMSTMYDMGQGGRSARDAETMAEYSHSLERAKSDMNAMLEENKKNPGSWSARDIQIQQNIIDDWQRKYDAMAKVTNEQIQQKATQESYKIADSVQRASERDITRAKEGAGAVGRLLVDAGASMTQTTLDGAVNGVLGAPGSMGAFAMRAFGGGTQQARQNNPDSTLTQQVLFGTASAAKEVFTEKMFNIAMPFAKAYGGGALDDVVERGIRSAVEKFAKTEAGKKALGAALTFGAGAVGEGLEEFIGDWMEWQLPRIYGGDVATAQETLSNSLYDFLVGATSGAMGGIVSPNTYHYDLNTQQATQQNTQPTAQQAPQERTGVREGNITVPIQNAVQSQQEAAQGVFEPQRNTTFTQTPEQTIRQRAAAVQDSFERTANSLGENGQKAFRAAYTEGADRSAYAGEFLRAYHAGLTGQENPNSGSAVSFAGYTAAQRDAAASLAEGKRAAQFAKTAGTDSGLVYDNYVSQEMDSAVANEVNTVSKALGVRTRIVDQVLGGQANGQINGSDILIAKDAVDPALQVVGHEWTHRVQKLAPEQYRAFRDAVTSMPDVQEAANILLDQYNRAGVETSYEQALDEATANYAGELIQNSDVLDDFIRRHGSDRTMLQKLRDAIHEIVGKLTGRAKRQAQTVEGKLQAAFEAASRQADSLNKKNTATEGGEARYSLNEDFSRQFDEWLDRKPGSAGGNSFLVGTTSDALKSVGVADYEIYWRKAKIAKIMSEHPSMTADVIKSVPNVLEHPILVMQSQTVANRITLFGETVDADGKPVLAALELSPQNKKGEIQDFAVIASAYGKNNAQQLIDNSDILYVDPNKKRTDGWLGLLRLQLPSRLTNYGSIGRVTYVNRDVNGNLSFGEGSGKTAMQEAFEKANEKTRYSLKEYSDQEKRDHRKEAIAYFGKTYNWNETGYLTPAGTKLDFSGRHEGGPGGYRTVDHRDIRDALGDNYGGDDYSGSMVQFMSEGNIRISPESGGINLSVEPTKSQLDALSDFISKNRGEVILDLDTTDGQTVSSTEYPRGTHSSKVLNDIKAYFKDGTTPHVSEVSQFLSLKGTENAQELAALKRENDTLKERVAYWKSQTRRTQQVTTDKKSVAKAADALVKDYGANIKGSEIASDLQSLYDYIASGKDGKDELTYTEARRRSDAIAEKIAESAVAKDDQTYQDYADLRKFLKDTRMTLTAQDAAEITDFNELRKSQFGKVKFGTGEHTNIDQIYSELAERYPEFFSEQRDMNISDQVQRIADVADHLYTVTEYNPFEGYMGQAVASISNDIMDRFFDLPQTKKTFADRQAEQLQATRAAGKQAAQDAFLAGQIAQGRQDAKRLRSTAQALAKERTRRAEQLEAMRNRYREKDVARRESQKSRELRAKIIRHADAMSRKLLRPTDTQHIPENMRSAVAAVLNSINRESKYTLDENRKHTYDGSGTPTKRALAFENLREQYQKIASDSDMVVDPTLLGDSDTAGSFAQVIQMGDTRLADLSREQLQTMWNVLKSVEHSVSTAGKTLASEKFATTRQFADSLKTDTMSRRRKLGGNVSISLETPYTFFAHFGQTGKDIYRLLRNAQDRQEVMARDVTEKVQQVLGDTEKAGLRGNAVTVMNEETHHFTTSEGKDLTLTTAQAMNLYLLSERQQAQDHLLKGGIVQPEIKIPGQKKIARGVETIHLSAEDIQNIVKVLTPEQIRIADGLQSLTTGILAEYGNEASMQAYGYKKFTEKDYWPIKSTKEALHSTTEKNSGNTRSIKNIGMAQAVKPNASTTLEVRSVFDTFADHASDMIDYAAWLCPMEDVNRLYNFQFRGSEGNLTRTIKDILEDKGGQGSQQYWRKLMDDIQNGIKVKDFEPLTDQFAKGIGSFKGAAVGANLRVVIQQPTAFFRASVVLNPADMAKGIAGGVTKGNGWEKAVKYSPIAMRKDVGSFDISSPYTLNDRFYGKEGVINKVNEAAGTPAGAADAITWGALWNACEWQVKREKPSLRAGSSEFYSAVNEVFTDMIDQTQVVDGILQRSNIMRGKSDLAKQATSFMGEPIMSLNVFMRAWDNMRYEENPAKRSAAIKGVGRAAAALLVTNVVNAMAQSLADANRDDDEDKGYWEKYMTALTGITGDEKTMKELLTNVLLEGNLGSNNNPVGNIPFLKDILSLAQGYSVSRTDMQVFSDIVSASKTFIDSIGGNGKKTRSEAMAGMFAACAKLFGLPVSNIKRDVTSTINTAIQATGNVALQYEWDKLTYNISNTSNKNRYLGLMFKALEQGDLTTYEHIRKELKDYMAVDSTTADSAMRTRLDKKQEEDEDYRLPKESATLIGAKTRYDDSESEDKFDENDLSSDDYIVYSRKKAETYSSMEAGLTGSAAFQKFSDEQKDKALSSLETYAKKTALQSVAGSDYEITDKWILKAQEAEKKYKIKPEVYIALKTQVSGIESVKDRNGEAITNSKGLLIMQAIYNTPGLTETQRNALFEYMGVGKSIRHFNKTLVNEKVRQNAKKAGK